MKPHAGPPDDWQFYQHQEGPWSWRQVGAAVSPDSDILFLGIVEAMADAALHGYAPGVSHIAMEQCRRMKERSGCSERRAQDERRTSGARSRRERRAAQSGRATRSLP